TFPRSGGRVAMPVAPCARCRRAARPSGLARSGCAARECSRKTVRGRPSLRRGPARADRRSSTKLVEHPIDAGFERRARDAGEYTFEEVGELLPEVLRKAALDADERSEGEQCRPRDLRIVRVGFVAPPGLTIAQTLSPGLVLVICDC